MRNVRLLLQHNRIPMCIWGCLLDLQMLEQLFKEKWMLHFQISLTIMDVYQDDLTTYSKKDEDHCMHLENTFVRALEYGILLNTMKCIFGVTKGKLLEYIVS